MITEYLNEILRICCEEMEVDVESVKSRSRKTELVQCRVIFIVITKEKFNINNEQIGKIINKTKNDICYHYNHQPETKYFKIILEHIKKRVNN